MLLLRCNTAALSIGQYRNYEWVLGHLYRPGDSSGRASGSRKAIVDTLEELELGGDLHDKHDCVGYWGTWSFKCLAHAIPYASFEFEWPKLTATYYPSFPRQTLHAASLAQLDPAYSGEVFEEAAFLHVFDWKKEQNYFIGHAGAAHARAFEVKKDGAGLTLHASQYHVSDVDEASISARSVLKPGSDDADNPVVLALMAAKAAGETADQAAVQQEEAAIAAAKLQVEAENAKELEVQKEAMEQEVGGGSSGSKQLESQAQAAEPQPSSSEDDPWRYIAANVAPVYQKTEPRFLVRHP